MGMDGVDLSAEILHRGQQAQQAVVNRLPIIRQPEPGPAALADAFAG